MRTATRADHQLHTFAYEIASPWAFRVVIVATQPTGKPNELAQLMQYVRAKRQQLHADRCHGILIDDNGVILDSVCITNTEAADMQVDPLVMTRLRPREPKNAETGDRQARAAGIANAEVRQARQPATRLGNVSPAEP